MGGPKIYLEHGGGKNLSLPGISLHSFCVSFSLSIIPVFFLNKVVVFSFSVDEIIYRLLFCWATSDNWLSSPAAFETVYVNGPTEQQLLAIKW